MSTHARSIDWSAPGNNTYCTTYCPTYKMSLRTFRVAAPTLLNCRLRHVTPTTLLSAVFQIEHILDLIYRSWVRNRSYRSRPSEPLHRIISPQLILSRMAESLGSATQRRSFDRPHKGAVWTVDAEFIVLTLLSSTHV